MLSMACSALLHLGDLPSGKAPVQGNVVLASSSKSRRGNSAAAVNGPLQPACPL